MYRLEFKVKDLIDKYYLSQRKVAMECNIRPTTLKMYCDNAIKRIDKEDLESLYNFFSKLDDRIRFKDIMDIINEEDDF